MFNVKSILLLGITGALLTSGCASYRVLTDLKPEADATLQSPAGRFYIAGLKYINNSDITPMHDQAYERDLLILVRKECLMRYPALFERSAVGGVPIWIDISDSNSASDDTIIWMLCTVMIVPMILPMPAQMDRAISVDVGVWNGTDSIAGMKLRQDFRREEHAWTSLTPLALFPIPGESDLPKKSEAIDASGAKPFKNNVGYYDAPQVAQQVATATAKLIATKDPLFWTTQPRLNSPTVFSPTTRPVDAPVVPPVPSDSPTPF